MTDLTRKPDADLRDARAQAAREAIDQMYGYYTTERPAAFAGPAYDEALPEAA